MDRHALLITAYRDEPTLVRLLRHFSDPFGVEHFRLFVHVDRKSKELDVARLRSLGIPNLEVCSKYKIHWGSINHVYAVLDMMKLMLAHEDVTYVHVVSGTDMAIRSSRWIYERFAGTKETSLELGDVRMADRGNKDDWYGHYWLASTFNPRNKLVRKIRGYGNRIQQILGVRRLSFGGIPWRELRFALVWASYCREACEQIVTFSQTHRAFLRSLNWTLVPEEAFFGTALVGTPYQAKNDTPYLRYADWSFGRGERPATLDERDYAQIVAGDYAFVRKIDSTRSSRLIDMLTVESARMAATGARLVVERCE